MEVEEFGAAAMLEALLATLNSALVSPLDVCCAAVVQAERRMKLMMNGNGRMERGYQLLVTCVLVTWFLSRSRHISKYTGRWSSSNISIMSRIMLLEIPIDAVTRTGAVERLQTMLVSSKPHHVMTPNSEMLVAAQKDEHFRRVLQRSDLNLPDSQGIVWMAAYTGHVVPERVTGIDTVIAFCATLTEADSIFLLGAAPGVASIAAVALANRNPHLKIAGTFSGSPSENDAAAIVEQINAAHPHILFVAYGAPAQDIWIAKHLKNMPSVRIAMGVGGTFDFLAGTQKRAPKIMQRFGFEWLWRLVREPSRLPRILNAVLVFPWLVIRSPLAKPRPQSHSRAKGR